MDGPHRIFDRALLAERRNRLPPGDRSADFLIRHVADDIADRLAFVQRNFSTVLDLGAGSGIVGRRVKTAGVGAEMVIAMDASPRLLAGAAEPKVVADEELLPFRNSSLDLVVSALSLQLVNDLPGALVQIRRALRPDGLLIAGLLGARTLEELREAFIVAETETLGGVSPRVAPFADVRDLGALLQRAGFALPVADSEALEVGYASPLHLMHDIRGMGWSNMLADRRRAPMGKSTLARVISVYQERFGRSDGRVKATFEVITLTGWAPHESQQKPLRPGSASSRLADALNTSEQPAGDKPEQT